MDGQRIVLPRRSDRGVWLGEAEQAEKALDTLETNVYRRIDDEVPTRLFTVFEIHVAGTVREERIGPALPDGFVPLSLSSDLPVQLSPVGDLRVQVRPGTWLITLGARAARVVDRRYPGRKARTTCPIRRCGPTERIPGCVRCCRRDRAPWTRSRWVRVGPSCRHSLYEPGESLTMVEHSRGLADAGNSLQLVRKLWLDFDGSGFAFADAITGEMLHRWRLDMAAPYALQNATEHGGPLLVTRNDALAGVGGPQRRCRRRRRRGGSTPGARFPLRAGTLASTRSTPR